MTVATPAADYLTRIGRTALLTAEQEVELAKRIEAGLAAGQCLDGPDLDAEQRRELRRIAAAGRAAKNQMIEANLRLVVSVARRYAGTSLGLPDLIQEGNLGLITAVEKFDHRRGLKFSTYAVWWIKQAMLRALADQSRTIRVPAHMADLIGKVRRARRDLGTELGREPTPAELARVLELTPERVTEVQGYDRQPVSLHTPVGEESGAELGELIEDRTAVPVDETLTPQQLRAAIRAALGGLTTREAEVLELRYGLDGDEPRKLEQIGAVFGLTRERIRQIEAKAMGKLRRSSTSTALRAYLG